MRTKRPLAWSMGEPLGHGPERGYLAAASVAGTAFGSPSSALAQPTAPNTIAAKNKANNLFIMPFALYGSEILPIAIET